MPLSSHGPKVLVALEGEASRGISLGLLAFVDLSLPPLGLVSPFICTTSNLRCFVLSMASQHIGSCVPVDRISNVDRRGR